MGTPRPSSKASRHSALWSNLTSLPRYVSLDVMFISINSAASFQGFIPRDLIAGEVDWFYFNLGIDDSYFQKESSGIISDHIISLFGAKIVAYTKRDPNKFVIDLERIDDQGKGATFIHTSAPGLTSAEGPGATCEVKCVSISLHP